MWIETMIDTDTEMGTNPETIKIGILSLALALGAWLEI
jgi:hypothetical protein